MLSINLLPTREKKMIFFEDARRVTRFFAVLLSIVLTVEILLLAPSYLPLVFEQRELERSLGLEEEASKNLEVEKTKNLTQLIDMSLRSVKSYSSEAQKASSILDGFLKGLDQTISIASINVKKNGDVTILGEAGTRRQLLDFEKQLRESGRFQEVSVRLTDIVKGTDINFSIQGKLKPEFSL